MKRENIIKTIDLLEEDQKQEAYFGIFFSDGEGTSYIKANKKGMVSFIKSLLKILLDFDFHLSKTDHYATINFRKEEWFDKESDIKLEWVEPSKEVKDDIIGTGKVSIKTKWYQDAIFKLVIVLFLASLMVGFIQILIWIYKLIF